MPLTQKLLRRPDALARLRDPGRRPDDAYLISFNVTELEQALAESLELPLFGSPPHLEWLGSKTGSKRSARQAGTRVLEGTEDLWSLRAIEDGMELIRAHAPHAEAVVVKLNYGFAGQGNAIVELETAHAAAGRAPHRVLRRQRELDLLRGQDPGRRGHRRGTGASRGDGLAQCPAAGHSRGAGRDPVHPRPDPERARRPGVLRLPLPGRPVLPAGHPGSGRQGRRGAGRPRRHRDLRHRFPGGSGPPGQRGLRERDQPAHGRHDPPVLDGPPGHRGGLRPAPPGELVPPDRAQALRGDRQPARAGLGRDDARSR